MKFKMSDFGFITDCACIKNRKAFKSYNVWVHMIDRCYNKNSTNYLWYGEKGVTICDEWKLYSNFKKWFDENYIEGCVVDKDISGGSIYSPETCVFISKSKNSKESCFRRHNTSYMKYASKPTIRSSFKKICKNNGWDFDDFEEAKTDLRSSGNNIMYTYIKKEGVAK